MTAAILSRLGSALAIGITAVAFPPSFTAEAYSEGTHRQIVLDAFDYMLNSDDQYVDPYTGRHLTDRELLRQNLVPNFNDPAYADKEIIVLATLLADASHDTDLLQDVWFQLCFGWCSTKSSLNGIAFTVFSHFLNVHSDGLLWPQSGYYYGWVSQNSQCASQEGFEDQMANLFVQYADAKFDLHKSHTFIKYAEPLKQGIRREEYNSHFNQGIQHVHFWPITNLANYWYNSFLNDTSRVDGNAPFLLEHLGPVLHAAADTTVPFHAVGLSGCGHVEYEAMVETLYKEKHLYDKTQVKKWLTSNPHLLVTVHLDEILIGNAKKASTKCKCKLLSCNCPIVRNETVAEEMLNLGVASTIVVIRKSLIEWKRKEDNAQRKVMTSSKQSKSRQEANFYSNWASVPSEIPLIWASTPDRLQSVESKVTSDLSVMRGAILDRAERKISYGDFNAKFYRAVDGMATAVTEYPAVEWKPMIEDVGTPKYYGMPSVATPSARFRLPTIDEIRDNEKWALYIKERQKFNKSQLLFEAGKRLAFTKIGIKKTSVESEKRHFEEAAQNVIKIVGSVAEEVGK